jgi:hypothetical protein
MYATKNAKTKTAVESRGVQAQILLGLVFLSRWFPQPFNIMNHKLRYSLENVNRKIK